MRLETARLVIRTFEAKDAGPWLAMVNDPEVRRFLPPGPVRTKETFRGAIERRHTLEHERGYAMWAVDITATGAFIGQCGFQPVEGTEPEVELAYHFNKASWGSGYATEAAMAVLAYGLGPAGLDRVIALVVPENIGSWRVLEKIGMRYEGLAEYHDMPGLKKYVAEREWWRPPLAIRRATPEDAPAVADVWLSSFKATYPFPPAHPDTDVRRWIRDEVVPRDETFVAVEPDGSIVGFMTLHGDDLDQLYVRPDRFNRGIGSRFVNLAKELRPQGLWLYTFQVNTRARAFYERHGFRVVFLGNGESNEEHQPDARYAWTP